MSEHEGPGHATLFLMLVPLDDLNGDKGRHMRWWQVCECSPVIAELGEPAYETVTPPESVAAIEEACRDLPVVTWTGGGE